MALSDTLIIADLSRQQATAAPRAAVCTFQGRTTTFAELEESSNAVAHGLLAEGIRPGDRVAILSKNSDIFLEIAIGVLKAGGVLVPLNWRLAPPEVAFILSHGRADILFAEADFLGLARDAQSGLLKIIAVGQASPVVKVYSTWKNRQYTHAPSVSLKPDDVILQMYTSGTTGLPKGVQLTNRNYGASFE